VLQITLTINQSGRRFDRVLAAYLSTAPKSLIQKLLRKKRIKLNGKKAAGNEITNINDVVTFYMSSETVAALQKPPKTATKTLQKPIKIIYEDSNILLVDKPQGLLTHSNKPGEQDTLVDRIIGYLKNAEFTPSVCNRLDYNTSGLVACAKNMPALQALNAIFANRQVDKIYFALVQGELQGNDNLHGYIIKDTAANRSYILDYPSESAIAVHTEYASQKIITQPNGKKISLLKIILHTGKSHQIRAHLANIGHPLVGDKKYGAETTKTGQKLHCQSLIFKEIPTTSPLHYLTNQKYQAPIPNNFYE